jgi:hypothetical protein
VRRTLADKRQFLVKVSLAEKVRFCEGFRTTAHRDSGAGTGAVVRKPPGKEPAGIAAGWPPSRERNADQIKLFERALALAPGSVAAQNTLAIALASRTLDHMTDTPAADLARAKELAERPSVASPRNALAHYVRGTVLRALAPSHSCRQWSADSWRSGLP